MPGFDDMELGGTYNPPADYHAHADVTLIKV